MDKETWELDNGKVITNIEFFALQMNLKLLVIVNESGKINKFHDFLSKIPFSRSDN